MSGNKISMTCLMSITFLPGILSKQVHVYSVTEFFTLRYQNFSLERTDKWDFRPPEVCAEQTFLVDTRFV